MEIGAHTQTHSVCMHVHKGAHVHVCIGVRGQLSLSILWVSGIKSRLLGLVAIASPIYQAISLA